MKNLGWLVFSTVFMLAACDQSPPPANAAEPQAAAPASASPAPANQPAKPKPAAKAVCANCGVISAIRDVKLEGQGTGMGAVSGAAAGGLVGNQFGGGNGKIGTTAAGVVLGAVAGHYAEKEIRSETVHRLTVRMDDGSVRTVDLKELNGMGVGMKVKVSGNSVYPRD